MAKFDIEQINDTISPVIYGRGKEYFEEGKVANLRVNNNILSADVFGTEKYRVRIESIQGELECYCSCPYAQDAICKHIVAVLLAWQDQHEGSQTSTGSCNETERQTQLKQLLTQKSKQELTSFILEHIPEDKQDAILVENITRANIGKTFSQTFKTKINSLFRKGRFFEYQDAISLADKLAEVSDHLDKIAEQDPNLVLELSWYLLKKSKNVFNDLDDSSGAFGTELDNIAGLLTGMLSKTKPSPQKNEIIQEIFQEWLSDEYGYFDCLQSVLIDANLSKSEIELLLPEIDSKIDLAIEQAESAIDESHRWHYKFRLSQLVFLYTQLMFQIHKTEEGLNRFRQYLPVTQSYHELGNMLLELKRYPEAETVFLEGLQNYPGRKEGIYAGLITIYKHQHVPDKLKSVLLTYFYYTPGLSLYKSLKELKLPDWIQLQQELIRFLDKRDYYHILIEIYLAEKKLLEAFELAKKYDAGWEELVPLGGILAKSYPQEAIWCYHRAAELTIAQGSRYYPVAVRHIAKIRQLYLQLDKPQEFMVYLQQIKNTHQKKRALLEKLASFSAKI